ncbi:MAG: WYL domain-containing protein [Clostridia bacterium]|nr:WYL domain-containing protein [Clostridia bacterium]
MREFYVYGFRNREEYRGKSARSYDDERRRLESWLGNHMRFVHTPEGKNVFISIDSRTEPCNPLYQAWKAKSFTDGDITLHFILFDILHNPSVMLSLKEILTAVDSYLSATGSAMVFDESTVRKKLKEYTELGLIVGEKSGKKRMYRRADAFPDELPPDVLHYFSEAAPCGVIGSFLLDGRPPMDGCFGFKHHYITSAMDSEVLADLFSAMQEKRIVTVSNLSRRADEPKRMRIIPLRVLISVQSGRQHLMAYHPENNMIKAFRVDYLSDVRPEEVSPRFDELRAELDWMQTRMWGVTVRGRTGIPARTEHVEFTVRVKPGEEHIIQRLEREKRVGYVEQLDEQTWRFTADVYDSGELRPWIRSFLCRISSLHCSNRAVENQFRNDLDAMYRMYGIGEEGT